MHRARRWLLILLNLVPALAGASTAVSPAVTMNGAYTVSWSEASGGAIRAYLQQSFNGGAWAKTTVTGTTSKAYTGKAVGSYAYKVQIYEYDYELRREVFQYETNVATVQVITAQAPGVPGTPTGPALSENGDYTVSWTGASGVVTHYELKEGGTTIYTGLELQKAVEDRPNGVYGYTVRACNSEGCSPPSAALNVSVELTLTATVEEPAIAAEPIPPQGWVGTLPGEPAADGGAAGYRIDIEVPPGRQGMQPRVSLGTAAGAGMAWWGWGGRSRRAGASTGARGRSGRTRRRAAVAPCGSPPRTGSAWTAPGW